MNIVVYRSKHKKIEMPIVCRPTIDGETTKHIMDINFGPHRFEEDPCRTSCDHIAKKGNINKCKFVCKCR